jgi:AcrR family transcriptional regulator
VVGKQVMIPPVQAPSRLRNAVATRQAILASARRHFARENYENVGLREIAGDAGVDPALISRYFGGKEALFREVLRKEDKGIVEGAAPGGLAAHFAQLLVDKGTTSQDEADFHIEQILILLHSAASPKAGQMIREALAADLLDPVARALDGDDPDMRAALAFAVLMGVGIMRHTLAVNQLECCADDQGAFEKRLTNIFAAALEPAKD